MLTFATSGLSLGFSAGTLPGALQTYLLNTTLTFGWRKSIVIIFAPLIVDVPLILLVVLVMREFPDWFLQALRIGGGLLLFWIAYDAWRQLRAGVLTRPADIGTTTRRGIFGRALLMNAISPGPYLFWSTVNGPLLVDALAQSPVHAAVFLVSFYGTFIGLMALLVFAIDRVRTVNARLNRVILSVTIVILLMLGTLLILQGFGAV